MTDGKNILFVDDESHFLDGIRRLLYPHRQEWSIHCAKSVDQALDLTSRNDFEVIVTDAKMPDKTGFDLLAALKEREETANIPVILLTASAEKTLKRRALDMGATDLLNKPVVLEDLVARIRSAQRLKSYEDELKRHNLLLEQKIKQRTAALERSRQEIVWRLAKAGEYRDEETGNHIIRVGIYCRILALKLNNGSDLAERIFLASPLHDIGKIGIPDAVLLKPGKLTAEEWELMKRHCEIGHEILMKPPKGLGPFDEPVDTMGKMSRVPDVSGILRLAASIALSHHEKWDGRGYPRGLAEEDIPLEGRIVALADVYDALRSDRPYKKAFSIEKSMAIMSEAAGLHFDPQVFEAFAKSVIEFEEIRAELKDEPANP